MLATHAIVLLATLTGWTQAADTCENMNPQPPQYSSVHTIELSVDSFERVISEFSFLAGYAGEKYRDGADCGGKPRCELHYMLDIDNEARFLKAVRAQGKMTQYRRDDGGESPLACYEAKLAAARQELSLPALKGAPIAMQLLKDHLDRLEEIVEMHKTRTRACYFVVRLSR